MKTKLAIIATCHLLSAFCLPAFAQGTAFTYQGQLNDGATPANGNYDFQFYLRDAAAGGNPVGATNTSSALGVTNGLFTVTLDFGNQFPGADRWLEIGVRTNGAANFVTLALRQKLTPTPYAIFANTASNVSGTISAANLSGTYGNAVTLNNTGNSFTGDGNGLTGVNAATLNGLSAGNFWQTTGNAGTTAGVNFVGTTDNQPLELRVNSLRALRLEPVVNDANHSNIVNVVQGSPANFVSSGVAGATIGGGGANNYFGSAGGNSNSVTADFGTVGGGYGNAAGLQATVGGGYLNTASGLDATVGGGEVNTASNINATVAGGAANIAGVDATVSGGVRNTASGDEATVGGGGVNVASGYLATVSGGYTNVASGVGAFIGGGGDDGVTYAGNVASGNASVVAGGLHNSATNSYATIGGGAYNVAGGGPFGSTTVAGGANNTASAANATVGGGYVNTASTEGATVPGGEQNTASGFVSFAAGFQANAKNDGAFVWADDSGFKFSSTTANQFRVRTTGGAAFVTAIDSSGNVTAGVHLLSGDTAWSSISDKNAKKNFQPVNGEAVLEKLAAIPVEKWNYKWEADTNTLHIGPMAQDFIAAFYPGRDDKGISTLEFDGVELAAIQGLNEKIESGKQKAESRLEKLEAENADLKVRLEKLEQLINTQK